jgi:hypothetical protein
MSYNPKFGYRVDTVGRACFAFKNGDGFWSYYADNVNGTTERDGAIEFDGKVWRSQTGRVVHAPKAVMDDFCFLVAVEA